MMRSRHVSTSNLLLSSVHCRFIKKKIRSQFALYLEIAKNVDVAINSTKKGKFYRCSFFGKNQCLSSRFYFLIRYGVCKKRKYCNRMSDKKNSLLLTNDNDLYALEEKTSQKKFPSVCLSVCLSVWMYVCKSTFHVDAITFEGVNGSKQNLVGVFYVWNAGLVLKSKVISWSWSWSWFWTEFWFSQKLCGATQNLGDIFSI